MVRYLMRKRLIGKILILFILFSSVDIWADTEVFVSWNHELNKKCDLIIQGKVIDVRKIADLKNESVLVAGILEIEVLNVFKGDYKASTLTLYVRVGGCVVGGSLTENAREDCKSQFRAGDERIFLIKKELDGTFWKRQDYPFTERNIYLIRAILNGEEIQGLHIFDTSEQRSN